MLVVRSAAIAIILLALSSLAAGQQEAAPPSGVAARGASEWRRQIDLAPILSDSEAMKRLVVIYRPSYRQTLFVFGTGRLVLQTYPDNFFNQSDALLPTCTANVGQTELAEMVRIFQGHLFNLPQKSFAYTGVQSSEVQFEKELWEHSIVFDDGTSRTYRAFAEGAYAGEQETIPPEFRLAEKPLRGFVERLSDGTPCHVAPYMEWRRTARGESVQ